MNEFISILISFIFMSLADSIDSAFNNYISVDAIVVCGSLIFIKFILNSIGEVGIYTYSVVRKNESSYLLISGIVGLILGAFSFVFSDVLTNLFNECFPYIILYSCTVFGLYLYESYKAICVVQGKTKILLEGSIVGVIVRVIFCLLFLKTPICLYVFGLASFIDFFTRGVIYKRQFLSKPI